MTTEDEKLEGVIIDQLNAEMGAAGLNISDIAKRCGRPYDSTRNYLRKVRAMPFVIFIEIAAAIGLPAEVIIERARQRLQ